MNQEISSQQEGLLVSQAGLCGNEYICQKLNIYSYRVISYRLLQIVLLFDYSC